MAYQSVIIKSYNPDLVLDANLLDVKLQHFNGSLSQVWTIEPAGHGKHYIVNKGNGKVLDVQGGIIEHANVITTQKPGGVNPEWFINSDSTIVTASGNLAVDIFNGNITPGERIQIFPNKATNNQKFFFQNH